MTEPFLGEIRLVSFTFPPQGWAMCNGQLLPINQNQALYSILGTQFGGNGVTNFALPDLRGSMPVHRSDATTVGNAGGEEAHTLTPAEMPAHTHQMSGIGAAGTEVTPGSAFPAITPAAAYAPAANTPMSTSAVSGNGGSQAHQNLPPFLALNATIALQGIFPSQN